MPNTGRLPRIQIWYGILVAGCIVSILTVAVVSIFGRPLNCSTTDEVGLCFNVDVLATFLFVVSMLGIVVTLLIEGPQKKKSRR
jgi:hypothetical protein